MRLFRRLASTVTVLLAAGLLLAPAAAADPGFSTGPRIVEHPPSDSPRLVDLRAGRHATFDRVVFHIDGQIPWYSFRYVPVVRQDGSGLPISLRGSAFLEVVLRAATDIDGRSVLATTRLRPDFPALREVRAPGSFEGQTVVGVGVSERVGFRVFELTGPNRIVLDLAHPAGDGPADGPKALTVTPNRGPVGTRVTVEGEDCAPGSARTLLVMQNGGSGTDGMAGLGEFPNDAQGRFRATVTIPDRLDERQGSPGGPTRPGTYAIGSLPPVCMAQFTVTASAAGDAEGDAAGDAPPGTLPFTGARSPLLLAIGGGLLVAGAALLALVRRRQAPAR
jgi:LPXTG-motif cell wall-anchored protein